MDNRDSHHGGSSSHAFRDITNTKAWKSFPLSEEQGLNGSSSENDRKRRRPFYEDPGCLDKGKNQVIHPTQDSRHAKRMARSFLNPLSYDSKTFEGKDELQREFLVDKLSLEDISYCQLRLSNEADNSTIGHLFRSNNEVEDVLTESDEIKEISGLDVDHFLRHPVNPIKNHKEPAFSDLISINQPLSERKADVAETQTHEISECMSLCGNTPCSLCTKAAYMWSDLIYQDARGRLSALKSSRRHARILEGKILRPDKTGETSQSQFNKARCTESDLLHHWASLILQTEDTLLRDIMQTSVDLLLCCFMLRSPCHNSATQCVHEQSRLIEIEHLKDKLKRDLEKTICQLPKDSEG